MISVSRFVVALLFCLFNNKKIFLATKNFCAMKKQNTKKPHTTTEASEEIHKKNKKRNNEKQQTYSRSNRTRTHDIRFWRPTFYQLNYTPKIYVFMLQEKIVFVKYNFFHESKSKFVF